MAIQWKQGARKQNSKQTSFARSLRKNQTDAEKKLWYFLRELRSGNNFKFRRQVPFGRYYLDFYRLGGEAGGGIGRRTTLHTRRKTEGSKTRRLFAIEWIKGSTFFGFRCFIAYGYCYGSYSEGSAKTSILTLTLSFSRRGNLLQSESAKFSKNLYRLKTAKNDPH